MNMQSAATAKKQWNLDKQRARKMAAKKAAEAENKVSPAPDAAVKKETPDTEASAKKKSVSSESTPKKKTAGTESAPKKKTAGSGDMPKKKSSHDRPDAKRRTSESGSSSKSESDEEKSREKTGGKSRSKSASHSARSREDMNKEGTPAKKPVKKRTVQRSEDEDEQRYGNIPSEKVRSKKEKAVRKGYEDMLATDPDRKPVRKKKSSSSEKTKEASESSALKNQNRPGTKRISILQRRNPNRRLTNTMTMKTITTIMLRDSKQYESSWASFPFWDSRSSFTADLSPALTQMMAPHPE